jgi:predicted HNH restriction endonuclease
MKVQTMELYVLSNQPSTEEYVHGLKAIEADMNDIQRRILRAHYEAPLRSVTSPELAARAEVPGGHSIVNAHYGRLGHMFCDATGLVPDLRPDDSARYWAVWSKGIRRPEGFTWIMHNEVAEALEMLGWVQPTGEDAQDNASNKLRAVDLDIGPAERRISTVIRTVRDTALARAVKELHNHECQLCGMTIELPDGRRYAEVHHIKPLGSEHGGPDLPGNMVVLCPNHHAMCDLGVIELRAEDFTQIDQHHVEKTFLDYHNANIFRRTSPK